MKILQKKCPTKVISLVLWYLDMKTKGEQLCIITGMVTTQYCPLFVETFDCQSDRFAQNGDLIFVALQ